eukprot:Protomagalhaensia_wolfi_Nauph_80__566@NODE_131_length_3502_cov_610_941092_g99_i0_p4_GENE_NODE_131_length_3502_cov_610_941092_g99_i0NODE_131_length_3502_cov_610_941092_g99_i0_p4_ORF_typecomplete_len102_score5_48Kelch_3/PF13415_6/1_7_NODE_131_length_3502_cov_610_941092_g99_i030553360
MWTSRRLYKRRFAIQALNTVYLFRPGTLNWSRHRYRTLPKIHQCLLCRQGRIHYTQNHFCHPRLHPTAQLPSSMVTRQSWTQLSAKLGRSCACAPKPSCMC